MEGQGLRYMICSWSLTITLSLVVSIYSTGVLDSLQRFMVHADDSLSVALAFGMDTAGYIFVIVCSDADGDADDSDDSFLF